MVRLRQRLNTVLLQWFLLLVVITGTVWMIAVPRLRQQQIDERQMVARTVAQSLDATISTALQDLDRLSATLSSAPAVSTKDLHAFRLQSPFSAAAYVLDESGATIAADPAGAEPIPPAWLGTHETATALIQRNSGGIVAIIQPFDVGGHRRFAVAEMNSSSSAISAFLHALDADASVDVAVVDATSAIVADSRTGREPAWRNEVDALNVSAPMRFAPWRVVVQQPATAAFAGLRGTTYWLLSAGIVLALMGVLLTRTLSRSVVAPIRSLSVQAEAMRAGDLSSTIGVSGDHEVEVLGRTLDDARSRLASTLDALQAFNERLEEQVAARTEVIVEQDAQRKVLVRRMLSAIEDERRRFARELHDEIAQLLTVIQMSLHDVQIDSVPLQRVNALLSKTQSEIHRIIHALRPALLDDLGLAAAIRSFADDHLRSSGVHYSLEIEDELPPRPDIDTVIFRIFQELVTNIIRHAGAEQLSIQLYERAGHIVLDVEDDGRGFDANAKTDRAGVTGMRERAGLVNGTIRFDSEPGAGTHVVLEIPLS